MIGYYCGMIFRTPEAVDAAAIARIWWQGWKDGHLGNVPDELVAARTEQSFFDRAQQRINDNTVVAVVDDAVCGFVMVVDDEVEQVYVDAQHRGSGTAEGLLHEAEQLVLRNGHTTAWLAVVEGNVRARRFYERNGWSNGGLFVHHAPEAETPIEVPALRYTIDVAAGATEATTNRREQ
jgi:ribosomal protein S18 acetylase RimI-like enzyme